MVPNPISGFSYHVTHKCLQLSLYIGVLDFQHKTFQAYTLPLHTDKTLRFVPWHPGWYIVAIVFFQSICWYWNRRRNRYRTCTLLYHKNTRHRFRLWGPCWYTRLQVYSYSDWNRKINQCRTCTLMSHINSYCRWLLYRIRECTLHTLNTFAD